MKTLFSFFVLAFSVLAFQKMSGTDIVNASCPSDRNFFSGFECPLDGTSCIRLCTVVIRPEQ